MTEINIGPLSQFYNENSGPEIFKYLTDNKNRLETASDLNRPAVEAVGVAWMLPSTFPIIFDKSIADEETFDKGKQLVGRLVKIILAGEKSPEEEPEKEYKIKVRATITRDNNIFGSGTKFERK